MVGNEARQLNGDRHDFVSLCLAEPKDLETALRLGSRPDAESLAGWEFRCYVPSQLAVVAGLSKVKKGFLAEDSGRAAALGLHGYNVDCHPGTLGEPWIERTRDGVPVRHGWFDAYPVSLVEADNLYPNALLLNYRSSTRNHALHPYRALKDYVVQVYPDDADLLVGKIYVRLGKARLFFSFFVLQRHNEARVG